MSVPSLDQIADAVIGAFPRLSPKEQRASFTVYRLLAKGQPVTVPQISSASSVASDAVAEMLGRWHGVERDEAGAVTAFWGLTLRQTKHRFRIGATQLHTWCGWDTLFLPALLGVSADVESTCPVSGKQIVLRVAPDRVRSATPESAVLSFVLPNKVDVERSVTETFCCHVHFFASAEAGKAWVSRRQGTFILSIEEGQEVGARKNAAQFNAWPKGSAP